MRWIQRGILFLGVLALIVLIGIAGCRQVLQHRAIYPGGLTFVGGPDGFLGSRYERVFLWKAAGYTDSLPEIVVHIEDTAHPLGSLTPALFTKWGGTASEGALFDTVGSVLRYRFEGGRLTSFSLDTGQGLGGNTVGGNVRAGQFGLSRDGVRPVVLPVTGAALSEVLGPPQRTRLVFAQ